MAKQNEHEGDRVSGKGWALDQLAGVLPNVDTLRARRVKATLDVVAEAFEVDRRTLTAANIRLKEKSVMVARQIAAYLLREDCELSFKDIATELGWRNHTSSQEAYHHIKDLQSKDETKKLSAVIDRIRESVKIDMKKLTIDKPAPPGMRM